MEVDLPGRAYPVLIGDGALETLPEQVRNLAPSGVGVVTDENVEASAGRLIRAALAEAGIETFALTVAPGETTKTLAGYGQVLEFLEDAGMDRAGLVIAIGGGMVGDLTGFAAATWLRGIRWLQVPTTLLAMVDSSVGGKTGVNTRRSKNSVGAFWQPSLVISDPRLLQTLPDPEYRAAYAEVVKYAIAQDAALARFLTASGGELLERRPGPLAEVVSACVRIKAAVVAADERDVGGRAILNYGHTAGHALEVVTGYGLPHGQAVAFGLLVAARIARALDMCDEGLVDAQDRLLAAFGLPGQVPEVDPLELMAVIPRDKKARAGEVAWVLPRELGRADTGCRVPSAVVESALRDVLPS